MVLELEAEDAVHPGHVAGKSVLAPEPSTEETVDLRVLGDLALAESHVALLPPSVAPWTKHAGSLVRLQPLMRVHPFATELARKLIKKKKRLVFT